MSLDAGVAGTCSAGTVRCFGYTSHSKPTDSLQPDFILEDKYDISLARWPSMIKITVELIAISVVELTKECLG